MRAALEQKVFRARLILFDFTPHCVPRVGARAWCNAFTKNSVAKYIYINHHPETSRHITMPSNNQMFIKRTSREQSRASLWPLPRSRALGINQRLDSDLFFCLHPPFIHMCASRLLICAALSIEGGGCAMASIEMTLVFCARVWFRFDEWRSRERCDESKR